MCGFNIINIALEHLTHRWSCFQYDECVKGACLKGQPKSVLQPGVMSPGPSQTHFPACGKMLS